MDAVTSPKRPRADAERSTERILEAAEVVLAADPNAPLERVAEEAGLARATVHRRFASRQALMEALGERLNQRYRQALQQARVRTGPPMVAFYRVAETVFELKISHRFSIDLVSEDHSGDVVEGVELLFARLYQAKAITVDDPSWCRRIFLAVLHEVDRLPPDSPSLSPAGNEPGDVIEARAQLLVRTVLGALGGSPE